MGVGFEAWRALVNKYEPTSKASVVGKLVEILRTSFDGDLLDAITTFERKIMIYEAQSRETIRGSLKIGCVIAGMGQNSMRKHFLMSAANATGGRISLGRLNQLSTQEKPSLHRHRWKLMHSRKLPQVRDIRAHCERVSEFEPWRGREASMCAMWKKTSWTVFDTELHNIPQRLKVRRMERNQKRKRQGNPERRKVQRRKRRKPRERKK